MQHSVSRRFGFWPKGGNYIDDFFASCDSEAHAQILLKVWETYGLKCAFDFKLEKHRYARVCDLLGFCWDARSDHKTARISESKRSRYLEAIEIITKATVELKSRLKN